MALRSPTPMMLFILLNEGALNSTHFFDKIYYNHEKCVGGEKLFSIGELQKQADGTRSC